MFVSDQLFPSTDKTVKTALTSGLSSWAGLFVGPLLPKTLVRRMVTVRNDGGPTRGRVMRRGRGINVWAETRAQAELLALAAMHVCQSDLPGSDAIAATSDFVGPREVPEDTPFTVGQEVLSHYYFSFTESVLASNT